jgi:hypothetical protein
MPKNADILRCEYCDYECCKQSDWNRHISTKKHTFNSSLTNDSSQKLEDIPQFNCENCKRSYRSRVGLWYHLKKCKLPTSSHEISHVSVVPENLSNNNVIDSIVKENTAYKLETNDILLQTNDIIKTLLQENAEFKQMILEQNKQIIELCKNQGSNNTTHTNSHNKTFNLQLFLNEQCKDAMNITDFVKSLNLQMEDLESLGELGYVEGMTNMIAKRLREIDIYKRPIHCSDAKREIIHIKHEDKWHKEEPGNPIFRSAVKMVVGGNFRLLAQWTELHPESSQYHSRWNDVYNKLVKETSGGHGDYETNNNTIMRRLTKLVVIEK